MKRIMVIGCSGSGKTELSRKLAAQLGLPLIHLDALYWKDNWQASSSEEFDDRLLTEIKKPAWVIDGNHNRTIPLRLSRCDTVIYLDYPRRVCVSGVIRRTLSFYGKSRPEMGGSCPEHFDLSFLKRIWQFNRKHREWILSLLGAGG